MAIAFSVISAVAENHRIQHCVIFHDGSERGGTMAFNQETSLSFILTTTGKNRWSLTCLALVQDQTRSHPTFLKGRAWNTA